MKTLSLVFWLLAATLFLSAFGFSLGEQVQSTLVLRCITGTLACGAAALLCWPRVALHHHHHEIDFHSLHAPTRSPRSPHHTADRHHSLSTDHGLSPDRHSAGSASKGNS